MSKRILALILVFVVALSLLPTWAAGGSTTQADVLYQLNLLKGTGTDYNLDGRLKRSEAVAFVVRLLGAEAEVLAQKEAFSKTKFSDMTGAEWFAPYVGYAASKGILNGFQDGTFKPSDYVSEKAFIKMVLVAMGYQYNVDFNWDTALKVAYQKQLLTDIKYATTTADNSNYLRGSVVQVMYSSLTKALNGVTTTVAQRLVSKGIFDNTVAVSLGLVAKDPKPTVVERVDVKSTTSIEIVFNEKVTFAPADITIVQASTGKALAVKNVVLSDLKATLTTDPQVNTTYNVVIKNITDKEGFTTSKLESVFSSYVPVVVNSDYFRISSITAISKSLIEVYFTQPVNSNAAIPVYYELSLDSKVVAEGSFTKMTLSKMPNNTNGMSIWLKEYTLITGAEYSLAIKPDLQSLYGVKLGEGTGDSFRFLGNGSENQKLLLQNVIPVNDDVVRVVFNKPVNISKATSVSNYTLKDVTLNIPRTPFKVIATGMGDLKNKQFDVVFTSNTIRDNNQFEFTLKDISDEFNASTITEEKAPFFGSQTTTLPLKLEYVAAINQSTIQAYFNQPLDASSVNAAITLTGLTKHTVVVEPLTPYIMTIYLNQATLMTANQAYPISFIAGLKPLSGKDQAAAMNATVTGNAVLATNIPITAATFVANDVIKVVLGTPIGNSNAITNKYVLEYKDTDGKTTKTLSCKNASVLDSNTLLLAFDGTASGISYTLKCTNLMDYTNQFTTPSVTTGVGR